MVFEKELKTYQSHLPELQQEMGKFVLIKGEEIVGIRDTYEDALKEGYERFGLNDRFMIKQIQNNEAALFFTRDIGPICR